MEISGRPKRSRLGGCFLFLIVGSVATVVLVVKFPAGPRPASTTPVDRNGPDRADDNAAILYAGQAAVTALLREPGSAEFSRAHGRVAHSERVACGFVNARNGFGGMTGPEPWLVRVDRGVVMIHSGENDRAFVRAWNRYCAAPDGMASAPPTEFLGVRFGAHPPMGYHALVTSNQVWTPIRAGPHDVLGVPVSDPWIIVEHGRVEGGGAIARGQGALSSLRDALSRRYGAPSGRADANVTEWDWGAGKPRIQLSYNPSHDQVTVSIDKHVN